MYASTAIFGLIVLISVINTISFSILYLFFGILITNGIGISLIIVGLILVLNSMINSFLKRKNFPNYNSKAYNFGLLGISFTLMLIVHMILVNFGGTGDVWNLPQHGGYIFLSIPYLFFVLLFTFISDNLKGIK